LPCILRGDRFDHNKNSCENSWIFARKEPLPGWGAVWQVRELSRAQGFATPTGHFLFMANVFHLSSADLAEGKQRKAPGRQNRLGSTSVKN